MGKEGGGLRWKSLQWPEHVLACRDADAKRVYYLSMEFLMGRSLLNALNNLGVVDQVCRSPHPPAQCTPGTGNQFRA